MKILLVCTGNTCRSVLAEGYFKKLIHDWSIDWIEVKSAGISAMPHYKIPTVVLSLLKDENVDVSSHMPTPINKLIVDSSDLILVMDNTHKDEIYRRYPDAKDKVFLMKEYALYGRSAPEISFNNVIPRSEAETVLSETNKNLEIFDPIGNPEEVYLERAKEIKETVKKVFERIINERTKKDRP
ncbi:MAG: hypothetical protein QME68_00950 [Elusimicrobiota bacterium]|nr:hypothetical protein [Elusimicrobiota bacterium]